MADAAVFADEIFGFHVQQAAEKLLKAWLALLGEIYPTTNDLARLLAMLSACEVAATRFNELVEYTPLPFNFVTAPGDLIASPLDRGTAIERVEALLKEVRRAGFGSPGSCSSSLRPSADLRSFSLSWRHSRRL